MVFNLLEFNKRYKYYWWLLNTSPTWGLRWGESPRWGETVIPGPAWGLCKRQQWPTASPPDGVEIMDSRDYDKNPPLNRKCNVDNIHETILAEYVSMWANSEHLKLYFRVYNSISNRIIRKITRKGLDDANNATYDENNIVERIKSYLPSGLPVDNAGMLQISKRIVQKRKKKRLDEEAQLAEEMEQMELSRCLTCRAIEMILQASETADEKKITRSREASNEGMKRNSKAERVKRRGLKRKKEEVDRAQAERMESVKFIYLNVRAFE